MKRVALPCIFTILLTHFLNAQTIKITGIVKEAGDRDVVSGVVVTAGEASVTTDEKGVFTLEAPAGGAGLTLSFSKPGFIALTKELKLRGQRKMNIGDIMLAVDEAAPAFKETVTDEDRIPVIALSSDEEESEISAQNVSGLLSAAADPFVRIATFNLSNGGFDIRGYEAETVVLFNGIPFNSLESGAVFWSTWGGLNDVTRNRESSIDLSPLPYSFGGVGGASAIDIRASEQRKQKRISYMFSNRAFNGRFMGTWSTGMLPSGWAFSFSGSRRWAKEGYVPGTSYDAWAYFASIDRKIGRRHLLNFVALGSPVKRGAGGATIEDANDIVGSNFYNPNWGWQNGEKRNARIVNSHQPLSILRHDWQISDKATLMTSVGYLFGRYGRTGLDWYKAPDPRPDYYRKLPLYFSLFNQDIANELRNTYLQNPDLLQIQWHQLYEANRSGASLNGLVSPSFLQTLDLSTAEGSLSPYALIEQRSDGTRLNASSTYQNILSEHLTINFGLTMQREKTHYFSTVNDLLGGDYYVNLDNFDDNLSAGQSPNFNVDDNSPDVRVGDVFEYNYDLFANRYGSWLQGQFSFRKIDFFAAAEISRTDFYREGLWRNGRFPNNSLGKSTTKNYLNYAVKGGITYKINGRNYLYANAAYMNRPPDPRNAFIAPRLQNGLLPNLTQETVYAAEAGYQLRSPFLRGRASFFYTQFNNGLKLNRFFLPGEITNFGAYVLNGIDRRHAGLEAVLSYKISPSFSATGVAFVGEYLYTDRPKGLFVQDDDGVAQDRGDIYIKNFYVPNTPQTAFALALDYRSAKFWSATINFNYFDRNYIDISPERRTADAVFGLDEKPELYDEIVNQTRLPEAFTVDLFANKSWRINDEVFFYLTAGVTNLLNASVITGGFEQLRFERAQFEETGINVFPPRYFYAFGTNFFVLGAIRF
jgi:hypothetical protein